MPDDPATFHGGRLIARRLAAGGVSKVFTLSGGHLFSIYDGLRAEGIDLVDVRHEATAAFAAEGWAKATRTVGVAALTAGPGVTNGVTALAAAQRNNSPILVLGGRAPAGRWGQGSLQELDHLPLVRPVTKLAATAESTAEIPGLIDTALGAALAPPSGPVFLDFPLDFVFMEAAEPAPAAAAAGVSDPAPDGDALERALVLLRGAARPVVMAGTNLYWGHGETALVELIEEREIPVFLNGLGRGCVPADHELFFSRSRRQALGGADVAVVIGVPMDFRLGFGAVFGEATEIIVVEAIEPSRAPPRRVAAALYGPLEGTLRALRRGGGRPRPADRGWREGLREAETAARAAEQADLADARAPLHPMRIYGELGRLLDRDAIVVGDGGDFVSYAGRLIDSYSPGCWLDSGPFGCLGSGLGYAIGAKLAHPGRQVVLLVGDGAFGFAGMELDTLARHGIGVVVVIGNNGIWGLEKHPMEWLYGYSVAADLRPGTRYDLVAEALGCHGELVERPGQLRPALMRALAAGGPALVNVLTDPAVAYPRRSNLA
ncbi:MAG: acetolactate synthase [Solirubrobacteraceae bacterium]